MNKELLKKGNETEEGRLRIKKVLFFEKLKNQCLASHISLDLLKAACLFEVGYRLGDICRGTANDVYGSIPICIALVLYVFPLNKKSEEMMKYFSEYKLKAYFLEGGLEDYIADLEENNKTKSN